MAYFLIGNHGTLCMAGDPGAPRLPVAIGPGDEPLLEIPLIYEDVDADPLVDEDAEPPRGVFTIDLLGDDEEDEA